MKMKKTLLATVAAAALVGFTTMATAENATDSKGAAKPAGATEQKSVAPGGSGGAMTNKPSAQTQAPHATQGAAKEAKPEQRVGEEEKSRSTAPQRGAEEEQKSKTPQRGAENEHGADQKKAQEEREPAQKGAQGEAAKPSVSQSNKAEGNQQNAGKAPNAAAGKVQLSQDQRGKIHSILGKSEAASVTNVNFNISVGVAVPRDVHIEVLPEDVVEVVPQYEGYDYIVVRDEILIIDPDSLEIVAIIA
jgi:type IV secretory pathway VirB10-like protein